MRAATSLLAMAGALQAAAQLPAQAPALSAYFGEQLLGLEVLRATVVSQYFFAPMNVPNVTASVAVLER